ncbi:hypothetical protein [Lactococcus formosensis]|uniref:hypothetical protein n=1 Tax=Lactococcus formosensis TaxID=1281486 RepID=UPI00326346FA
MSYNPDELIHTYIFSMNTSVKIDTSFVNDMSEIKVEILNQTPELVVNYSEYPRGFKILIIQHSDRVEYKTNYPLNEVNPDEFVIEFPQN